MKIVIVGPGAIGSLFAAFLSRIPSEAKDAKHEVWLLDKHHERAEKINQQGIALEGISGKWQAKVQATADPQKIERADLIIISVKSYDTREAILHARSLVGDNTAILTLQNGIGNIEILGEIAGNDKIIGGITNLGATLLETGHVIHAGRGETIIGRVDGRLPVAMRSIREIFNKAGLETRISRDIRSLLWSKLVINVGINALTAIIRLKNGGLLGYEFTRRILREAVTEAIRVAKRKRIRLVYDDPLAKVEAVCEATAANVSSMLQDVLKKRRTEIEFINGVIVRQAKELGIPTPVNCILLDLVKTVEASYNLQVFS